MPQNPHDRIHGWNSYAPIFAEMIERTQPRRIIEIGSWQGASAIHMLTLAPEAHIWCVDTWRGSREHAGFGLLSDEGGGITGLRRMFDKHIAEAGVADRVTAIQSRSLDAIPLLPRGVDLVYVDGSHEYADVKADLAAYWPLVRDGGIMFGDDYREWYHTVRRAVDEFGKAEVDGNHWWFVKGATA